jgi:hypothetical protein
MFAHACPNACHLCYASHKYPCLFPSVAAPLSLFSRRQLIVDWERGIIRSGFGLLPISPMSKSMTAKLSHATRPIVKGVLIAD